MKKLVNLITNPQNNTVCQYIMGIGCIANLIMVGLALFMPFVKNSKYIPHIALIAIVYIVYAIYYIICTTINDIKITKAINKQETINLISNIFSWEKIDNIPIDKAHKTQIRGALKDIIGVYSSKEYNSLEEDLMYEGIIFDCEVAIEKLKYL